MQRWSIRAMCGAGLVGCTALTAAAQTPVLNEDQEVFASDGALTDLFGGSVALSGDVAVLGASGDDDLGLSSGSAYVYRWNGIAWIVEQKLLASDGLAGDLFGAVAASGDVAVVGAPGRDDLGSFSGAVYIYRWNGVAWVQEQKLLASDGAAGDQFGGSVAVSGDVVVVGARSDDDFGSDSGSAYVFRWNGVAWVQEQKLTPADGAAGDQFAFSVDVSGDVAVFSAQGDDDLGSSSGSAYIFRWNGVAWIEEQKLHASDGVANNVFGGDVAASGDVVVVGAVGTNRFGSFGNWFSVGSAYVYRWNGVAWVQEQELEASDFAHNDFFGTSVDVSGDVIAVSARGDDDRGDFSGSAYIYHWNGVAWIEEEKLLASDGVAGDQFGTSVAVDGDVVVGVILGDGNTVNSGSAYIFSLAPADSDADGLPDADEINLYGTDPNDPDSDHDGLLDGTEVNDAGTNPLDADSDDDGVGDGAEVTGGTNPLDPDTDGDGVADGIDDQPLEPGISSGLLEDFTRTLSESTNALDLSLFNGPNSNANKGRRNSLANRATGAANAMAAGDCASALEQLTSLLAKVDGVEPEPDWMEASFEQQQLADQTALLIALLMY